MLDWIDPIILNFVYAALGGFLTIWFMKLGCGSFNKIVNFNISDELAKGNVAVGLMICGMFIGIGGATGRKSGICANSATSTAMILRCGGLPCRRYWDRQGLRHGTTKRKRQPFCNLRKGSIMPMNPASKFRARGLRSARKLEIATILRF